MQTASGNDNSICLRRSVFWLALFAFAYTIIVTLLFQKFLLPLMPGLHAGYGLLKNDAFFYHQSAQILADNIHALGWGAWAPWSSQTNTTGNASALAALYAIFSPNPALIIPVNALLNAASATLLLLISRELWAGRTGNWTGLFVGMLFVISPTALSWSSQPLKDCYVISGILFVVYASMIVFRQRIDVRILIKGLILMVVGVLLITFVKPYYLKLLLVALMMSLMGVVARFVWNHDFRTARWVVAFHILSIAFIAAVIFVVKPYLSKHISGDAYADFVVDSQSAINHHNGTNWNWQPSRVLPELLDRNLETASRTRVGMIQYNQQVAAGSLVDEDSSPQSATEMLAYLPRALQIGLFAPFPDTWLEKQSAPRMVAAAETVLWYLIFPGIFLLLYFKRTQQIISVLVFATFFLTVFSYVTPNVGTLYRYRFVFEFLLMIPAVMGWVQLYLYWRLRMKEGGVSQSASREGLFGSAVAVSLLTLGGYIGFFLRDLILVRWLGAGDEVDAFFLGSMVPMFLVAVVAMPAGQALITTFPGMGSDNERLASNKLINASVIWLMSSMAILAVVLSVFAPSLTWVLGWNFPPGKLAETQVVMDVYVLIMLTGGLIIIANAILNATGDLIFPAAAQMAVPFVVIIALLVYGTAHGIYPVLYGMLVGQLMNLVLVGYELWRKRMFGGFQAGWASPMEYFPVRQYGILAVAALSAALMVPLANSIAATMPSGSVATIGIGFKVILLITGVIGVGLTTVMLPYFSNLVSKSYHATAQSDMFLFLLFGTFISIPLSLILRMLAGPLTNLLMSDSALSPESIIELIRIVQYGMVQLPFYVCGLIMLKFITAYQRLRAILLIAVMGVLVTILLGRYLAGEIGVSGISLAVTSSVILSSILMLWYVSRLEHFPVSNSILLGANWLVAIVLFIGLHSHMLWMLVLGGLAFMGLGYLNWKELASIMAADREQEQVAGF